MKTRTVVMTIHKIEADLVDVTSPGDNRSRYLPGYTTAHAQGGGEFHSWQIQPHQRCWIGDTVTVIIIDPEPEPQPSTDLNPPAIDRR